MSNIVFVVFGHVQKRMIWNAITIKAPTLGKIMYIHTNLDGLKYSYTTAQTKNIVITRPYPNVPKIIIGGSFIFSFLVQKNSFGTFSSPLQ